MPTQNPEAERSPGLCLVLLSETQWIVGLEATISSEEPGDFHRFSALAQKTAHERWLLNQNFMKRARARRNGGA